MNKSSNRWLYLILGTFLLLLVGLVYAWSVISRPIAAEYPDWSQGKLSVTFTLTMAGFCLGGLVGGRVAATLRVRYSLWISAALFVIGFYMAAAAAGTFLLYLGFGIICGFASGFAYNALMGSVLKWFPDKQGLASGISLMGFGMGSFLIGKAYTAIVTAGMTWRTAFHGLGIVLAIGLVVGGWFIRRPTSEESAAIAGAQAGKAEHASVQDYTTAQMLREPSFWLYFAWAVLLSAAAMALISQASGIVYEVEASLSLDTVATIVGLISIANGVGRVLFGGLFDRLGYRRSMLLNNGMYLVSILITIGALCSRSLVVLIVAFVCFGLSYGGVTPTNSAYINLFYGQRYYPMNFSIINLNLLLSSFGGTLAGMLYDWRGSYLGIFYVMIGAVIVGTVCVLMIRRPER